MSYRTGRNATNLRTTMPDNELREQLAGLHADSFGWAVACCRGDAGLAEDVLQIAYLKVLQGKARFDGRAALRTWWFAVIRRTAADEHRRLWWRRLKHTAWAEKLLPTAPEPESAGTELDRSHRQAWFERALAVLPARQREVLHLVFYQDLTIEQAAAVMRVSLGSARTHYHRGKQRLRQLLAASEVNHGSDQGTRSPAVVL